jgi:hypothetical protein
MPIGFYADVHVPGPVILLIAYEYRSGVVEKPCGAAPAVI